MSKITNTLNSKYLENDIFIQRYIKPNISWYASYLTGKRGISRVFKIPYAALMKKFFLKSYFEKIENYHSCLMPCVSLMSAEGIRNEEGKLKENAHALAPKGAIFVCPVASSLSRLNGLEEFEGDFINLEDEKTKIFRILCARFF